MIRERPSHVARLNNALSEPAMRLMENHQRHKHTMERVKSLIDSPWEYEGSVVDETREITFLRDFFNKFQECIQSCETLDVARALVAQTLDTTPLERLDTAITFWSESFLNEVYIFQLRMLDLVTFFERKYSKDQDFVPALAKLVPELRQLIRASLGAMVTVRGNHVHHRRHRNTDPELARLTMLTACIEGMGIEELAEQRKKAVTEAKAWLMRQVDHYGNTSWTLLDGLCMVLNEGIVTEDGTLIVPAPNRDMTRGDVQQGPAVSAPQEVVPPGDGPTAEPDSEAS
ncbi:hypothetical protein [Dokdonella sp.]|uniref:hypothetical protein n=1 Tax=Dokdonella sp. TaxID=2291710 RepID=UPI003528AC18